MAWEVPVVSDCKLNRSAWFGRMMTTQTSVVDPDFRVVCEQVLYAVSHHFWAKMPTREESVFI